MTQQVSYLIKTRLYYAGFPRRFQYYPNTMDTKQIEHVHTLALEAMQEPMKDNLKKCVICDGKHIIMGISGFLCDILKTEQQQYHQFCDLSGTRKVYGFFAFVWDLQSATQIPHTFPSIADFATLVKNCILPFWYDSENSSKIERLQNGIAVGNQYTISLSTEHLTTQNIPFDKNKVTYIYSQNIDDVLSGAITYAKSGIKFSLCTGTNIEELTQTAYDIWAVAHTVDAVRFMEKQQHTTRKQNEQQPTKWVEFMFSFQPEQTSKEELKQLVRMIHNLFQTTNHQKPNIQKQNRHVYHIYISACIPDIFSMKELQNRMLEQLYMKHQNGQWLGISDESVVARDVVKATTESVVVRDVVKATTESVVARDVVKATTPSLVQKAKQYIPEIRKQNKHTEPTIETPIEQLEKRYGGRTAPIKTKSEEQNPFDL